MRVFLHSSFFEITGTWQWEMETEAVFCSDVMFSFPADFTGTKAIFHPDDVEAVTAGLTANEKIPSLRFRIITTYGEVKTLHGENLLVHQEEEARVEEEMLQATMAEQAQKAAQHHLGIVADVVEKSSQLSASGAWYYNRASGIAWYSDFVYHLHGIPAQGLNAHLHTFYPFIHPDDALFATEFMERAFAGQVPLHIDYRILVGDDVRWVSYKAHWFFSNKGEPILGGIFQDITAHKSVEKELESFRSLVQFQRQQLLYDEQQINFGHWQISLLTRKTTYSDQYYRIFGLKPGALAPTTAAFLNYVHPEDRDRVEAAFKKIIYEHELSELEYRILRNDGKTRFILQRAKLITYEGEMIISGVIQDITVQRMLEKKQAGLQETIWQQNMLAQQAAEMANLFSWIIDLEEGAYHWSESFFRLMGFTKVQPQNITEKTLFSIIHPHDAKAFRTHWQKAVQQKEPAAFDFRVMQRGMVTNMKAVFSFHTNNDKTYFIGTVQNNTTEHVLQQQLSQRVQLAESLTENMIDRVMITDSDNTIMLWNAACEKAYGIKRLEAIGENFFDVFPQLKTEEEMRMFQRVHRGEKVVEEGRLSGTGNGYYNMSLMPVFQGGEVTGILHIIHDATDEVNLRKSLAQRLQLIESIVQSSVDRIIALDRNMNYLYWNKAAEEYYGLNKEAVLGKNILEVFPQLINDPSYGEIRRALRGEKIHISINPERQKYFETYLVPIKDDRGEVNTLLWMAHDLSKEWKLKEAQRRIQAKVEEEHRRLKEAQAIGHLGSFEWTVGDTVSFWSDELYRINGLEPQSEVITPEKVEQFIYPGDADRLQEIKERSLRQPGEYSHVHRIVRRDGEVRWVNHQWESIPDEEDKVIKVIGIVQDITEQVLAEEKLQSNDALLRSAE
ncbi:MAG TPA: PAS domain S-box protein, partial [Flavisolibacter sp.]